MSLENLVNAIKNSIGPDEDPSAWVYKEEVLMPLDRFLLDKCPKYKNYKYRLSREKTLQELLFIIDIMGGTTGLSRRKIDMYVKSIGDSNSRRSPIMIYKVINNASDYLFGLLGDYKCSQAVSMLRDELDPEYKKLLKFESDMNRSLNSARKKRLTAIAEIPVTTGLNLGPDIAVNLAQFTQRLTDKEAKNMLSIDTSTARRGRKPSGVKPLRSAVSMPLGGYRKSRKGRKSRKSTRKHRKGRKSRKY